MKALIVHGNDTVDLEIKLNNLLDTGWRVACVYAVPEIITKQGTHAYVVTASSHYAVLVHNEGKR